MMALGISDKLIDFEDEGFDRQTLGKVEAILACGDLPYYYLEEVLARVNAPLFFVRGNHDPLVEYGVDKNRSAPLGGIDLHARAVEYNGWLLAGLEGALRYRQGPYLYSQRDMWWLVLSMVPRLLVNRMTHGRYLDVLISHAPPKGVQDRPDHPHQGFGAFRWLLEVFRPAYHLHGHIHLYSDEEDRVTVFHETTVINTYGFQLLNLERNS